jgi:hypothetical protein
MPTNRNSTLYANRDVVNEGGSGVAQVYDAYQLGGRLFPIEFLHNTLSAESSGDSVNLCVIPFGARVVGLHMYGNLGAASAGAVTVKLTATDDGGTGTDITAATSAGSSTFYQSQLSVAGMFYTPAVGKAVVKAVWGTAGPGGGKVLKGILVVILPS